jgi:hypothetical protein
MQGEASYGREQRRSDEQRRGNEAEVEVEEEEEESDDEFCGRTTAPAPKWGVLHFQQLRLDQESLG